jgi:hypothetical protein
MEKRPNFFKPMMILLMTAKKVHDVPILFLTVK